MDLKWQPCVPEVDKNAGELWDSVDGRLLWLHWIIIKDYGLILIDRLQIADWVRSMQGRLGNGINIWGLDLNPLPHSAL